MSADSISTVNYTAVIADLRAKRDELDRTISMLEAMSRVGCATVVSAQPRAPDLVMAIGTSATAFIETKTRGNNNGIGEACLGILKEHSSVRSLSTREVTELLLKSGFQQESQNPINNVWSALSHRAKVAGDVVREGKHWRYAGRGEKRPFQGAESAPHVSGARPSP